MKVGTPSSIPSSLRLGITSIIVLMVISSPVVVLVNPALKAAPSTTDDYTSLAPSTIAQDGSDFTTQAALSGVSARQTNNIVGVQSYYDVVFTTTTTGTIKFIDITFPAGTVIGVAPNLVEREGIGAGTAAKTSATVIRYTVTSAVSVPAGTQIRLEFFNIVNPTVPNTVYKVTVTTRNAAGTAIDGPTLSNSLNMKQIGTAQIADGAVTTPKIADGAVTTPKIADQSVTVNKIQGFNKLIPGVCSGSLPSLSPGQFASFGCFVPESVNGEGILATWCGVRVPPSPVLINAAAEDETVNFGFENPSSVSTAAQPVVQACFLISNPPNGIP